MAGSIAFKKMDLVVVGPFAREMLDDTLVGPYISKGKEKCDVPFDGGLNGEPPPIGTRFLEAHVRSH